MTKTEYRVGNTEDEELQFDTEKVPWWTSKRLQLAILGFFGFINVYTLRANMSVAVVCMVNWTALHETQGNSSKENTNQVMSSSCGLVSAGSNVTKAPKFEDGEFDWNEDIQGSVLGAFFWGYLVTQIPGGWVATRFGGKKVFGVSMLAASVATFITPVAAQTSYIFLIVLRIILGICSGVTFPAMHALWGSWAPPLERSKLTAFTYAGAQLGNVITYPLSGMLCKYGFAGGWPSIFYVLGMVNVVWVVVWWILASDSPMEHKGITKEERDYITHALAESTHKESGKKIDVPWLKIFTSGPVFAIICVNVMSDWGAYTLLANIPLYLKEVLKFDITTNGLYSALPYIVFWAVINIGGWLADFMMRRCFTVTITRKSVNTFGMIMPALMLIGLGYVDCSSPILAIALLTLAVGLSGFQYSGWLVNHVDIAPAYAGILFGISNSIASVTGFVSQQVVAAIRKMEGMEMRSQWQIVFYVACGMYTFGALIFILLGSGELQPWAMEKKSPEDEELHCDIELNQVVRKESSENNGEIAAIA
ncbi:LOW QUALITY PROTEIN: uncharacterized transporter slc-17.2-like [Pecten maximus]|uniref:LOW QUALITY PROTEIN: uncharacterized transporter slc-17.2-like n=1 Tax=Pecten maximus TaxID=6579 RepID=UPI001458D244|nr:LOW QUALITY PROTEIN: uncharacterized transporter slc-17.2-like [Pecten maximus]